MVITIARAMGTVMMMVMAITIIDDDSPDSDSDLLLIILMMDDCCNPSVAKRGGVPRVSNGNSSNSYLSLCLNPTELHWKTQRTTLTPSPLSVPETLNSYSRQRHFLRQPA